MNHEKHQKHEKEKRRLVLKLRFPEFWDAEEWEEEGSRGDAEDAERV